MTSEHSDRDPLTVTNCDICGEYRLTAQTERGDDLCSECMRDVPVDKRPGIAKNLGDPESDGSDDEHDVCHRVENNFGIENAIELTDAHDREETMDQNDTNTAEAADQLNRIRLCLHQCHDIEESFRKQRYTHQIEADDQAIEDLVEKLAVVNADLANAIEAYQQRE